MEFTLNKPPFNTSNIKIGVQSEDILVGIGSADRNLLATLIALFEDSKLSKQVKNKTGELLKHFGDHWSKTTGKDFIHKNEHIRNALSVESKMKYWLDEEKFTDSDLRIILWIYIRKALQLDPVISLSQRSLKRYATEITVATIHAFDPPNFTTKIKKILPLNSGNDQAPKTTLDDIVVPVLNEMLKVAFSDDDEMSTGAKQKIVNDIRIKLSDLKQEQQVEILDSIGSKEFNDEAIRNIFLTGGGLAVFGSAVNIAGFSAYILAAQASAYIPLVSGPALVSLVSVLSNPITMIGGTVAIGYLSHEKANKSINSALAVRVVSLLALQGLSNRDQLGTHTRKFLNCFNRLDCIEEFGEIPEKVFKPYVFQWKITDKKFRQPLSEIDSQVSEWMDHPLESLLPYLDKNYGNNEELKKTAWVTGLTVGDITYSLAAIDPKVVESADFSRIADLSDKLSFAEFAQLISNMSPSSYTGALSNLKGYVAEHVVASQLALQGHDVELAPIANEPGWDILVDGEKFQIKSLSNMSGIRNHFNSHDYPVIANSELMDQIPSDLEDRVFFVDGFSDELVTQITESSLSHGADVFEPDVPLFALGVSTAFAIHDFSSGKIRSDQAMEQILMDGGTRVGLATLGGFLGSGIGLLVYGPAGALIWGSMMPILAQSQTTRAKGKIQSAVKTKEITDWEKKLALNMDLLIVRIESSLKFKIDRLKIKFRQFESGALSDFIKQRLVDEGRYLHEMKAKLTSITQNSKLSVEEKAIEIIHFVAYSTIHPIIFQKELKQISEILKEKPTITQSGTKWLQDQQSKWVNRSTQNKGGEYF